LKIIVFCNTSGESQNIGLILSDKMCNNNNCIFIANSYLHGTCFFIDFGL